MNTDRFSFHLLLHSAKLVEEQVQRRLAQVNLLPRQARMIEAMNRMGPVSQVRLAREFSVTPASMSTMTARLIAAGVITRITDPNEARSNLLTLTEKGQSTLEDIRAAWRDIDAMILDKLGPEMAKALTQSTHSLRDALGGHAPGSQPEE